MEVDPGAFDSHAPFDHMDVGSAGGNDVDIEDDIPMPPPSTQPRTRASARKGPTSAQPKPSPASESSSTQPKSTPQSTSTQRKSTQPVPPVASSSRAPPARSSVAQSEASTVAGTSQSMHHIQRHFMMPVSITQFAESSKKRARASTIIKTRHTEGLHSPPSKKHGTATTNNPQDEPDNASEQDPADAPPPPAQSRGRGRGARGARGGRAIARTPRGTMPGRHVG